MIGRRCKYSNVLSRAVLMVEDLVDFRSAILQFYICVAQFHTRPTPLPGRRDNSHLPPEDQRISLSLRERARVRAKFRAALKFAKFLGGQAEGSHPFPSRTRKLSPPAPTILTGQLVGKIGRRRGFLFGRQQIHKSKPLDALTPINSLLFLKVKFFSTTFSTTFS